jgi:hypothetical protein
LKKQVLAWHKFSGMVKNIFEPVYWFGKIRIAGKSCYFCSRLFEIFATSRVIAFRYLRKEESPDSIEQCTGEEPGMDISSDEVSVTDSATENDYHRFIGGKDENVR